MPPGHVLANGPRHKTGRSRKQSHEKRHGGRTPPSLCDPAAVVEQIAPAQSSFCVQRANARMVCETLVRTSRADVDKGMALLSAQTNAHERIDGASATKRGKGAADNATAQKHMARAKETWDCPPLGGLLSCCAAKVSVRGEASVARWLLCYRGSSTSHRRASKATAIAPKAGGPTADARNAELRSQPTKPRRTASNVHPDNQRCRRLIPPSREIIKILGTPSQRPLPRRCVRNRADVCTTTCCGEACDASAGKVAVLEERRSVGVWSWVLLLLIERPQTNHGSESGHRANGACASNPCKIVFWHFPTKVRPSGGCGR